VKAQPTIVLMMTGSVFLNACHTPQVNDLEAYIAALQGTPAAATAPRPELLESSQLLTQMPYHGEQYRNPFEAGLTQLERNSNHRLACEQPDLPRHHHGLENFALDQLTFIGTLTTANGSDIALVISEDGRLHRVAEGDYIGASYGRVIALERQKLTIREWLRRADGCWQQADVELNLSLSPRSF
jgi:type IV pilus assembly protein PilP